MAAIEVKVEGTEEVVADLNGLGEDLKDIPMEDVSKMYVQVTSHLAPKLTGFLANSIRPANGENKAGAIALAPYAATINYGSVKRNIRPTYFMNRADQILSSKVVDSIDQSVQDLIENRGLDA